MDVTDEDFEGYVADALDSLPGELLDLIDNVAILIEPEAPADDPHLLGRYDGIALTRRDSNYTFTAPDRILIFQGPLVRMCRDVDELIEEVRITVVHEIAHHFGIDDERLHAWGWG